VSANFFHLTSIYIDNVQRQIVSAGSAWRTGDGRPVRFMPRWSQHYYFNVDSNQMPGQACSQHTLSEASLQGLAEGRYRSVFTCGHRYSLKPVEEPCSA
jgi:hypothetical protein